MTAAGRLVMLLGPGHGEPVDGAEEVVLYAHNDESSFESPAMDSYYRRRWGFHFADSCPGPRLCDSRCRWIGEAYVRVADEQTVTDTLNAIIGLALWRDRRPPWQCANCGSQRWVAASLTGPASLGGRAIRQCVPCGYYSNDPVDGR